MELRLATQDDLPALYQLVLEIGSGENGFSNSLLATDFTAFQNKLKKAQQEATGQATEPGRVPQTTYWLFNDENYPVGYGKLRHYLNEQLKTEGGHIGYTIRPSQQQKGYGVQLLRLLLKKAEELEIPEVLVTCYPDNVASQKVILANGGKLAWANEKLLAYWITI